MQLVNYIDSTKAVSVNSCMYILGEYKQQQPAITVKPNRVFGFRFGSTEYTRVKFNLGQTVLDMGDHYTLTNVFFLDYIEDIQPAVKEIYTDNGLSKIIESPTPLPVNNFFTGYRFEKDKVDLDVELVGVIFGNRCRLLMNLEQKFLYTDDFFTTFTFPFILTPYLGKMFFGVALTSTSVGVPTSVELELLKRWYKQFNY